MHLTARIAKVHEVHGHQNRALEFLKSLLAIRQPVFIDIYSKENITKIFPTDEETLKTKPTFNFLEINYVHLEKNYSRKIIIAP